MADARELLQQVRKEIETQRQYERLYRDSDDLGSATDCVAVASLLADVEAYLANPAPTAEPRGCPTPGACSCPGYDRGSRKQEPRPSN